MRIRRVRASVAAALAAGGLLVGTAAQAAPLGVNLVADPSFEDVDLNSDGPFTSLRLNQWQSTTDDDWAYPYSSLYSGPSTPPGGGDYHFAGGYAADGLGSGHTSQSIDVSTGDSATAIAAGTAQYDLSGYFSTYLQQDEFSLLEAVFLGAGDVVLGTASVGGSAFGVTLPIVPAGFGDGRDWGQDATTGLIPVGTESVLIQLSADGDAANFDGYADVVDFTITQVPEPSALALMSSALLSGLAFWRRRSR